MNTREKRKIHFEELVSMQVAFVQQQQSEYMKMKGLTRSNFLYLVQMGAYNETEIIKTLPKELHSINKPNRNQYEIIL